MQLPKLISLQNKEDKLIEKAKPARKGKKYIKEERNIGRKKLTRDLGLFYI